MNTFRPSFFSRVFAAILFLGVASVAHAVESPVLTYSQLGLQATVTEPDTIAKGALFTVDFEDQAGTVADIKAKQVAATMEMPSMSAMGVMKVGVTGVSDSQGQPITGRVAMKPMFSMKGQWKISLQLTTDSGSETQSFTVDVQ